MESKCMSNALLRFSAVRLSQCLSPSTPPLPTLCNVKVNSGPFEGCTTGTYKLTTMLLLRAVQQVHTNLLQCYFCNMIIETSKDRG
jgi:hypothetical protein